MYLKVPHDSKSFLPATVRLEPVSELLWKISPFLLLLASHLRKCVFRLYTSPSGLCDHLPFVPFQTCEKSKTEHFTKQLETESKMEKSIRDNCRWKTSALEWKIKIKMWTWLNERIWISSVQCFSCCISLVCICKKKVFFLTNRQNLHCETLLFLCKRGLDCLLLHVFTATNLTANRTLTYIRVHRGEMSHDRLVS